MTTRADCGANLPRPSDVFGLLCAIDVWSATAFAVSTQSAIVDFACTKYRLAVEADGSQHIDSSTDLRRTAILEQDGWRILRFWNNDILARTDHVIEAILQALTEAQSLTRSPAGPATTLSRGAGEGLGISR